MDIITTRPQKTFAVIDVETTELTEGEIPKTLFWGYADEHGYEYFKTSKQLVNFLKKLPPKVLLHHTNFDVIQLLVDKTELEPLKTHDGRFIRCALAGHILQNSYTVFPISLEKIFNAFGYKKSSLRYLRKRNYEDCVNGLDCFLQLNDLVFNLIGVYPLLVGTVAGTTFKAAETVAGRMPKDLRFLPSYRGGRVEVFTTREMQAYNFDINSSYPRSFLEAPERDQLLHVEVCTRDWHCPLFDSRVDDMLLFPNGRFRSFVYRSNLEKYVLPYAEKTSIKILDKHEINMLWLTKLKQLIDTLYEKKSNTRQAGIVLSCKFLLNAFYGRIGLKPESERCRVLDYPADGDDVTSYFLGNGRWLCFDTVLRDTRSNYPFAAYITDNARCRLYECFKRNCPAYGDTDSIFTELAPGKFQGTIGQSCGDWAYKGRNRFKAFNVKDYEWGKNTVRKGGTENTVWTVKRFVKGQTVTLVKRTRKTGLRKRLVFPDGNTMPITVEN